MISARALRLIDAKFDPTLLKRLAPQILPAEFDQIGGGPVNGDRVAEFAIRLMNSNFVINLPLLPTAA